MSGINKEERARIRAASQHFSIAGLQPRPKAVRIMIKHIPDSDAKQFLDIVKKQHRRQQDIPGAKRTNYIDEKLIETCIKLFEKEESDELLNAGNDDPMEVEGGLKQPELATPENSSSNPANLTKNFKHLGDGISVYNVFSDVHPFDWNVKSKSFQPSRRKPELFPTADAKSHMMQERHSILRKNMYSRHFPTPPPNTEFNSVFRSKCL